jgi:DNA-binding transcriptional LysR family regulator
MDAQARAALTHRLTDRLDWNLLRTYLVIGQERSISRAAARLHLTQPAVSQALKRLEDQLERQLIVRRGLRFDITEAGETVLRLAGELYADVARLDTVFDTDDVSDVVGKVRLLSMSRVHAEPYDEFLAGFHRQYPRVDIDIEVLRSSDITSALSQRTATLGLGLYRTPHAKLDKQLFMRQRYAFYCGRHHRLFGVRDLVVDDLKGENFVTFTSDQIGDYLSPLTVFRDQQGFTGRVNAASSSLDEIRRLIYAGYGVGCLPEHLTEDDLARGRLWRLPPAEGVIDVDVHILWNPTQKLSRAEGVFLARLRESVAAGPIELRGGVVAG